MRTWAEIDLSALEHNYRTLRAMLAPGCRGHAGPGLPLFGIV